MHTLRSPMHNPYQSNIPPIVHAWIVPNRRLLLIFRHYWPPVQRILVCAILFLAVWPHAATRTSWLGLSAVIAAYLISHLIFRLLEQWPLLASPERQHVLNVIRHLGGIGALSLLIWLQPQLADRLWVLYLIPLLTIGVSLDRHWAFAMISLVVVVLFLSAFAIVRLETAPHPLEVYISEGLIRALLGVYVGLTNYILVRCLAYQYRSNQEAVHRFLQITETTNWYAAANTIAQIMADLFSDESHTVTANVLTYDRDAGDRDMGGHEDKGVAVIGSSAPDGRKLATDGFRFPADKGIVGWAIQQREPCFINDTHRDPEGRFHHENAFPGTRSALATPIVLDEHQVAVLELESPHTSGFAQEDVQLLETMGSHLIASHERTRLLKVHRELVQLGQFLAGCIIQAEAINPMLERIGEVALKLLDAQIIGFYYRDPGNESKWERCVVGKLNVPDAPGSPVNASHSVVNRLIQEGVERFFPDAQNDPYLTRRRPWHEARELVPFVVREGIVSCAAIPLVAGRKCIGLMYVNYRRRIEFTDPLKNIIRLLSPYSTLAIQSSLENALAERNRRESMRRIVHDSLAHRLQDVERGLDKLRNVQPDSEAWKSELMIVHNQVGRARRVVANLVGEQPWLTLQSIVDDLDKQAQLLASIYSITVSYTPCTVPDTPISLGGGNELMFACDEILGNAIRHSQPQKISIRASASDHLFGLEIEDDGIGFDMERVRWGQGLASIHERIDTLGGTIQFRSMPGLGASVRLSIPIPSV